jgi:lysophospholipid acyltransferase (LPLAT)-like uncharacterized protein
MSEKKDIKRLRARRLGSVIYAVVSTLGCSLRFNIVGLPDSFPDGAIVVSWHGRTLAATQVFRGRGYLALISHSLDGEMQDRVFTGFGFRTIRGSTGRGGVKAAATAIREIKKGGVLVLTPDGPKGPPGVVQPGLLFIAQKSGAPVYAASACARWRWHAPTWDNYMVPLLFSKVAVRACGPFVLAPDASPEEAEEFRLKVEQALHQMDADADAASRS